MSLIKHLTVNQNQPVMAVLETGNKMQTTGTYRVRVFGEFHCPFGVLKMVKKRFSLVL
jgi:hypothetical protein